MVKIDLMNYSSTDEADLDTWNGIKSMKGQIINITFISH